MKKNYILILLIIILFSACSNNITTKQFCINKGFKYSTYYAQPVEDDKYFQCFSNIGTTFKYSETYDSENYDDCLNQYRKPGEICCQ